MCSRFWCVKCKLPIPDSYYEEDEERKKPCPFCQCKYYGSIKKDKHVPELTDEIGTVIERTETYWRNVTKKGKPAKFRPAYIDPIHPDYYENSDNYPYYLNMIPCCFSAQASRLTWEKGLEGIFRKQMNELTKENKFTERRIELMDKTIHKDSDVYEDPEENLEEKPKKKSEEKHGFITSAGWQKTLEPARIGTKLNRGFIHPKLQKLFNFENYDNEIERLREVLSSSTDVRIRTEAEREFNKLTKNEKLEGPVKRFGEEQNGKIFHALATILRISDIESATIGKSKTKDEVLRDTLKDEISMIQFVQAKNGELVEDFSRHYSEFNNNITEFVEWIIVHSRSRKDFIKMYFKGSHWKANEISEEYIQENKNKLYIRQLYKIFTAYENYFENLYRLDSHDVIPLISEWKSDLYVCIVDIKQFTRDTDIELICPEFSPEKEYKHIAFINYQNGAYEPLCYDPLYLRENFKIPLFVLPLIRPDISQSKRELLNKLTEKNRKQTTQQENENIFEEYKNILALFEQGYRKTEEDYEYSIENIPLPIFNNEFLEKLIELYNDKTFRYYTDSWCKSRFIEIKVGDKKLLLPIHPSKMITKKLVTKYSLSPLIYVDGTFPEKLPFFNYKKIQEELEKINSVIDKPIVIDGIYVDEGNMALGFRVNDSGTLYFEPVEYSRIKEEEMLDLPILPYINEEQIEEQIFFDEIEEQDQRINYRDNKINEGLLYSQYKNELASAMTYQQRKIIQDLLDVDIEKEKVEEPVYLYHLHKVLWNHDKRERVYNIVEELTNRYVFIDDENPFKEWPQEVKRLKQKPCHETRTARACNNKPLCQYKDRCRLRLGGISYWTDKELRFRFLEMLTNDIFYGGKPALDILNNKVGSPDPRMKIIYNYSRNEIYLNAEETRDSYLMNKIFNINKEKYKNKTNSYIVPEDRQRVESRGGRNKKKKTKSNYLRRKKRTKSKR